MVGWRVYVWWERGGCEGDGWGVGREWAEAEDEEEEEEEDDDDDDDEEEEGNSGNEDEVERVGREGWQRVWIRDDVRPVRRGWRTWLRR